MMKVRLFCFFLVTTITNSVGLLVRKSKQVLRNINLFPSIPPSTDENELKNQKISTILFIILLILSLTILILYTSLVTITKTEKVQQPNVETYSQLYIKYPQTLICPCSQVSVGYRNILNITYSFHQLCASAFTTQSWINYFTQQQGRYYILDFRYIASGTFQALKLFCESVNTTIVDSLNQLYSNQYISAFTTPLHIFQSEMNVSVTEFISLTTNNYLLSLKMIRDTTQANALVTGTQTNFLLLLMNNNGLVVGFSIRYVGCPCSAHATCVKNTGIYYSIQNLTFTVPGMYTGCFSIESLLQSNLQCFYDQTCIDRVQSYMSSPTPMNVTALNSSLASQYLADTTIEEMLNNLMIEQWHWFSVYENYYRECQPSECTYTYETTNDLIYIVTTVIGLFGGLITILKISVPILVKMVRRKYRCTTSETAMISVRQRIRNLVSKLINTASTFNLFPSIPPSTDENELKNQKISTILFIILLILSLTILILYTSLVTITKTVQVQQPDLATYSQLYVKYPQTLVCPCDQVSVSFRDILNITYSFHQVCASDFITQSWIDYLSKIYYYNYVKDFRFIVPYTFQSLKTLCESVNTTIVDSLNQFHSNQYISAFTTPLHIFQSEMNVSVTEFISLTTNNYLLSLKMIRDTTQANGLATGIQTNYGFFARGLNTGVFGYVMYYGDCLCSMDATCMVEASFQDDYTNTVLFNVSGMYMGCFPLEALLQSNLQCFYDQTCIEQFQTYVLSLGEIMYPTALNPLLESEYSVNTTIEEMLNNLMVEQWQWKSDYENYYKECQPSECTYTYETTNELIYIVTTVIGLFGGLIKILKISVPVLVKMMRRKYRRSPTETDTNTDGFVHRQLQKCKQFVRNINLFPSIPPSTNENELKNQKISTVLFIILLILSLAILTLYTSLVTITKTVKVQQPNVETYSQLYTQYPQTFICPCNQISINYEKILNITYSFHQACASDFVSERWVQYLSNFHAVIQNTDFRWLATGIFQSLRTLCESVNTTIVDSLNQLYSNQYISAFTTPLHIFESQMNVSVTEFISLTTNNYLLSLEMIRDTTQANHLLSGRQTNYLTYSTTIGQSLAILPRIYLECDCYSSATCVTPATVHTLQFEILFTVPGMYIGCFVIEALRQSNLECFYNQTCIERFQSYLNSSSPMNATALNSSLASRYSVNTTIEEMLNNLMVEQWQWKSDYENYYKECQPSECTYTYETTNDLIYIVTTVIGLFGGLITTFKLLISQVFMRILTFIQKRKRRIVEVVSVSIEPMPGVTAP